VGIILPSSAGLAAQRVAAIETVVQEGLRTRDMGGTASTDELGTTIAERL